MTKATKEIKRSRLYVGMRNYHFETHDQDGKLVRNISEQDWRVEVERELREATTTELTYIFHDKDLDSHGDKKHLHVHFVARFANPVSYEATRKTFKCETRNYKPGRSESSALLYLTHTTTEAIKARKARYEVADLKVRLTVAGESQDLTGADLDTWYREKISGKVGKAVADPDEVVAMTLMMLVEGELTLGQVRGHLIEEFGEVAGTMAWAKNIRHFNTAMSEYYRTKYGQWLENGRDFQLVYIQGQSGIGKTRFANKLARKFNEVKGFTKSSIHNAPNESKGARYDFLNTYDNEAVTVFDDLDPTTFGYTEFLNLFERERVAKYSSRFNDKAWFAELAIITKSTPIETWTSKLAFRELQQVRSVGEKHNTLYQPRRRFSLVLELKQDGIKVSKYELTDKKTNEHKLTEVEHIPASAGFQDDAFQEYALQRLGSYLGFAEPTDDQVALVEVTPLPLEVADGEAL